MTTSTNDEFEYNRIQPSNLDENEMEAASPEDLTSDPDYNKLNEHFQRGEKDLAMMVLNTLEKRYPDHPELMKIKDELQLKSSVKDLTKRIEKGERRERRREFINLALFAVVGTIVAMAAFYFTSQFLVRGTLEEQVDQNVEQLTSLQSQVEQLLDRGRPQPAVEIIETMRSINPDWEALPELTSRAETLLQLEEDYNQALALAEQGQNADALALFQSIEATQPGLWDVRSQIAAMEVKGQVNTYLEQGGAAFQAGDWAGVISAYESALELDPSIDDPKVKEQLIQAYLNQISVVAGDQNASLEAIEGAEANYRRAVALIPQGGEFSAQREQLEALNDQIKELKYIRMARDIFADPFQTVSLIDSAVSYLRQAANLNPKNTGLQSDLQNAQLYRDGFQSFTAMNWEPAIQNFNQILSSESGFLQDHARVLLYESYYGLGRQYASSGQYGDALTALESAETFAMANPNNLMQLFQVQILIGDVFWQSGDPDAAFSVYQNAFENIEINRRLEGFPEIQRNYVEAINFAQNELFDNAYENIQSVFNNIDAIYTFSEVTVTNGASLVFVANNNTSTIHAINQANGLPNDVVVTFSGTLQVPRIEN
jgi:tetratricopeptide (TPR) repeat protein